MGGSRRARTVVPVSGPARALGIAAIIVAVLAVSVPALAAVAVLQGLTAGDLSTVLVGLLGMSVGLFGLILAILSAIVGKGAQSATTIVGGLLNGGVLLGLGVAVFLPILLQG